MKRYRLSMIGCALAVGLLIAIPIASADVAAESEASAAKEVEVTGSGWVVAADGTVTYKTPSTSAAPAAIASP